MDVLSQPRSYGSQPKEQKCLTLNVTKSKNQQNPEHTNLFIARNVDDPRYTYEHHSMSVIQSIPNSRILRKQTT